MHQVHKTQGVTPEMSEKLAAAKDAYAEQKRIRDELILEAHRAGDSLRDIAAKVGLSFSGVRKIINQENKQQ